HLLRLATLAPHIQAPKIGTRFKFDFDAYQLSFCVVLTESLPELTPPEKDSRKFRQHVRHPTEDKIHLQKLRSARTTSVSWSAAQLREVDASDSRFPTLQLRRR
ncbi:MAG: hypothetical protein O2931_12745, partial [Planctomycetota bacterium]|nr:hypothetical protein [Planctomycetota bacterium]